MRGPWDIALALFVAALLWTSSASAQRATNTVQGMPGLELGDEYADYARMRGESAGGSGAISESGYGRALLYLPNRLLDLLDIFRVDVGAGPGFGVVGRVTRYGQFGYRSFMPASLRVGLRGRRLPIFLERSSEFGVGPAFVKSHDREISPLEVGASADLFLFGLSMGVSVDELADFAAGLFSLDLKADDIR